MAKWTWHHNELRCDGKPSGVIASVSYAGLRERIVALLNAAEPGGGLVLLASSTDDGLVKVCAMIHPQDAARAYEKPNEIPAAGHKVDRQT